MIAATYFRGHVTFDNSTQNLSYISPRLPFYESPHLLLSPPQLLFPLTVRTLLPTLITPDVGMEEIGATIVLIEAIIVFESRIQ